MDAGLSNFQAFMANAFFTLGQVIFEVPTGLVADTYGRRISYLLGSSTLVISTLLYLWMWNIEGPFWGWALSSALLGVGFTFFSGALEAWLVDALHFENVTKDLDGVFAKGQVVGGITMLIGSAAGGVIAQYTNLGVPYIIRSAILLLNFATAFVFMKDLGFTPTKSKTPLGEMKKTFKSSLKHGFGNPPVRWLMLAVPFSAGVGFYVFYALQPFLLELYGDKEAYSIAGMVAALAALAQICGGLLASRIKKLFKLRTTAMLVGTFLTVIMLAFLGFVINFWIAFVLIFLWILMFAALTPIRQTYLNGNIPSEQRATVISFDNLMGSTGGIFIQPGLGKVADIYNYSTSFVVGAGIQALALPFVWLARREKVEADKVSE